MPKATLAMIAKIKAEIKLAIAIRVLSSPITNSIARGVALLDAEAKADTIIDKEKVLTANILEAMTSNKPSTVSLSI